MPVVQWVRRATALLALVGVLAPGGFGAIVALHVSAHHGADHHGGGHQHAADLAALWHGHSHPPSTPEHEHPLLLEGTPAPRVPSVAPPLLERGPGHFERATHGPAGLGVSAAAPLGLTGVGPPPRPERLSILRI